MLHRRVALIVRITLFRDVFVEHLLTGVLVEEMMEELISPLLDGRTRGMVCFPAIFG